MSDLVWPRSPVLLRARRCDVTMIVEYCADDGGYVGTAYHEGVCVLPQLVGLCATLLEADARTQAELFARGLWR